VNAVGWEHQATFSMSPAYGFSLNIGDHGHGIDPIFSHNGRACLRFLANKNLAPTRSPSHLIAFQHDFVQDLAIDSCASTFGRSCGPALPSTLVAKVSPGCGQQLGISHQHSPVWRRLGDSNLAAVLHRRWLLPMLLVDCGDCLRVCSQAARQSGTGSSTHPAALACPVLDSKAGRAAVSSPSTGAGGHDGSFGRSIVACVRSFDWLQLQCGRPPGQLPQMLRAQ
jgi:hypothetical protein